MGAMIGKIIYYLGLPVIWLAFRGSTRAYILLESANQVLFVKGRFGNQKYKLPGGGIKKTESPLDGAIRELCEETGIKLSKNQLSLILDFKNKHIGAKYRHIVFSARINNQIWPKSDNLEIIEAVWLSPSQISIKNSDSATIKALYHASLVSK